MHRLERYGSAAAVTIGALFTSLAVRYTSYAATITDASGYVSEAARWLKSDLFGPLPFAFWPAWPGVDIVLPLGYRPGPVPGTDVFVYPPGLPLAMSAAIAAGGELAAYLVAPVLGGALVWATSDLAGWLGGARARVIGAALMATSAIAFTMAVQPMSDVPAAAWWALSLVFALRPRPCATLAAGLTVSMAILSRPNLAPLAAIPAVLVFSAPAAAWVARLSGPAHKYGCIGGRMRPYLCVGPLSLFVCAAAIGPGLLMYAQHVLYGSPLASGHPGIEQLFALAHIRDNLLRYPRWYAEAHTPAALLAIIAPVVFWRSRDRATPGTDAGARSVVFAWLAFSLGVYALYLPYVPYTDWPFLRFMLPALAPLYALTAAVLARGIDGLPHATRWVAFAIVLALTAGVQVKQTRGREVTDAWKWNERVWVAGRYLDEVLPANAVVITFFHSGSVRHYTGRAVLRPDLIAPEALDDILGRLERGGYRPYLLVDEDLERAGLLARFPHTRIGVLDWPPRARIGTYGRLTLYDLADRERHARGEEWPVDNLR